MREQQEQFSWVKQMHEKLEVAFHDFDQVKYSLLFWERIVQSLARHRSLKILL